MSAIEKWELNRAGQILLNGVKSPTWKKNVHVY